ncbi:target of Nesh-SH3 isoform X37 [Anomalospiza imberbis]|uniref:target of Nesh-SH3 isoform X37 n=1 Tax=Anomalospiza imberbis TaxID=187417 RepID=UPI0035901389
MQSLSHQLCPVKRQSLKVQINATDDTVCMRYLRPSQSTKLEGFVLGYGSNFFSNQYIPLPSEGKNYVTELDAEPRYLVSVRPARVSNNKKSCSGRNKTQKPLQLVVGTLTPTSVFLSWGILVNPQHDWTATSNCASDSRFYTVRYREKGKDKKWVFQLCPATETVIDNLKPNTPYEFGVKDNAEDSIWSKTLNHKTVLSSKKVNGQLQNMYKLVPNSQTQIILSGNKKLVPVTIIKQIIQNRTQSKAPDSSSLPGAILVHLIVPGLNESQQKLPPLLKIDDIPQASRKKLAKNETGVWPAESKTPEVQEISPQSLPAQAEKTHGPEGLKLTPKPILVQTQNIPASNEIQLLPSGSRIPDAPKSPLTELGLGEGKPPASRFTTSGMPEMPPVSAATERPDLEWTSSASRETTRMAARRPRPKSSTPSSPATQQTGMASHDFLHVTSTLQTSTSTKMPERETATRESGLKITSHPSMETRGSVMAFDENQHISSGPETSGSQEIPSAIPVLPRPVLEPTSFPFLKTTRTVMVTERPKLKSSSPYLASQGTVEATERPDLEWTSSASRETTRMAARRPRPKSSTPSSPATQQTGMASLDSNHISFLSQTSASAEISKTETVTSSADLEKPMPPLSKAPHVLTTTAGNIFGGIQPVLSSPVAPSKPEIAEAGPAAASESILESFTPKTSRPFQWPRVTLAPKEIPLIPSKPKPSATPEVQHVKPAPKPPLLEPKTSETVEQPKATLAPKVTQRVPSKPKTSPKPYIPKAKDVLESITLRTDQLKPTIVPRGPQYVLSKPRTSPSPEVPRTRPVSKDTYHRPSKPKTSPSPHIPPTRASPKESRRVPSKPRASPSPDVPHIKPAPKETLLIPSKSKTSVGPEVPQTKPVPNETYHISPRPKIGQATEIPWFNTAPHKTRLTSARPQPSDKSQTRPAFRKTTLAPARTKAPGLPKWIVPTTDDLYTPEATARPIDMDVKRPPEYADTWQKPISATIPPGPQHPPIPPARPTQMRRKPLPPNTVAGKPGSPAKPAGPTPPVRTGTLHKTPTAFATPEYYVDAAVFSSSPTSETDSSGKPRYQAPHVKYMKKDDDVPCSITSSLEHFPQEEVGSKEEPSRPPQNPPTNLTVVTVEGCPSFVILDWEKPDNDTVTEYEVVSTENGGSDGEKEKSIITTNQTHSTVENLKPDTSYEFHVKPRNPLGEGPSSNVVAFSTESADPRVSEPISMGKDAIWTEIPFNSDTYSECKGKQYVKRTWYKKFVGVQLCNSLRYKIYLSDSLTGKFYNIGDQRGHGEDHCQFVDSFLDGRTGQQEDLPVKDGFFRAVRQEPVKFGKIGGETQINYVRWYECGTSIPGKW